MDSPGTSPKKEIHHSAGVVLDKGHPISESQSQMVDSSVARLSISEDSASKFGIVNSISNSSEKGTDSTSNQVKRRRSSVASINGNVIMKSRQNSTISLPRKKKKKKNSKPFSFTITDQYVGKHDNTKKISIKDIRDLTLYALKDTNNMPPWVQLDNRSSLQKMIVLFVPGLETPDFNLPDGATFDDILKNKDECNFKYFSKYPDLISLVPNNDLQAFPVVAPGSRTTLYSAYNSFMNVGLTKNEKITRRNELSKKRITIHDLLMDLDKLIENDYPIHPDTEGLTSDMKIELTEQEKNSTDTWFNTKKFDHNGSHTYALDCEMCLSDNGLVLTRASIVDFDCKVLYDKLVKPDVPIIDYLTKYSGITKEKLEPVTTTLKDVQEDILKIISSDDVLIGHSLQSDLNVLKLRHPKVVDTALIFDHKAGPPFKPALRYLASEYLHTTIQNTDVLGHNSIEDARTCMELTKLKIVNGMVFGISINTENLFSRLMKSGVRTLLLNDSVPSRQTGLENDLRNLATQKLRCTTDQEIYDNILEKMNSFELTVGRLRDLEFSRGFSQPSLKSSRRMEDVPSAEVILENLGKNINEIYEKAPSGTLIMILSGTGDTRPWGQIMKELNKLPNQEKMSQRKEREKEIERSIGVARDGVATVIIKQDSSIKND